VPTRQVVEGLFARIQARDWPRASDLVAEALTLGLPVARERFVGRDHFIRLQQEYPALEFIAVRRQPCCQEGVGRRHPIWLPLSGGSFCVVTRCARRMGVQRLTAGVLGVLLASAGFGRLGG
jgi:hypothetical protein